MTLETYKKKKKWFRMNRQCNLSLCVSYCKVLKPLAPEKRNMQWNKMSQWNMSIKSFLQNESFKMSLKQVEFTSRVVFKHSVPQHIPCSIIWSYLPVQEWTIIVLYPVWMFFLFFFFFFILFLFLKNASDAQQRLASWRLCPDG